MTAVGETGGTGKIGNSVGDAGGAMIPVTLPGDSGVMTPLVLLVPVRHW